MNIATHYSAVPRIDLFDLELIQVIANELSLSSVASRLAISGAAVSQRLSKIENIIGQKIAHRPGPLRLTKAGERLLQLAVHVSTEYREFNADIEALVNKTPAVRIMANASLIVDDLPQVIDQLKLTWPLVRIDLLEGSFRDISKSVLDGECDAGLIVGKPHVDGLRFLTYKTDRICVMAPLAHAMGQHATVCFVDALKHPLIGATPDKQISVFLDAMAHKENTQIHYAVRASSFEVQAHMVGQTDIGIAIVLESVARRFEKIYPVRSVRINDDWAQGDFSIVVRDAGSMSAPVIDFVRLMTLRHKPVGK